MQSHFETTFAHRARTRSTHKFLQWQRFILVLFNWQIRNLVHLWSDMSSTDPSWMRFRFNAWGTLDTLQFLSTEHSFPASLTIKSFFGCYLQIFANGVCIQCHNVQLVEQYSKWPSSGCCPSKACMEHFISCIHTTLTNIEIQSCLETQVVLIMSPTNLLEIHPLPLKLCKENTGQRTRWTLLFWEKTRYLHVDELQWYREFQNTIIVLWSHISWNTSLALCTCAGMNCFVPDLALIRFRLLHVHFVAQNNATKWHHLLLISWPLSAKTVYKYPNFGNILAQYLGFYPALRQPHAYSAWAHQIHFLRSLYQLEELWALLSILPFIFCKPRYSR